MADWPHDWRERVLRASGIPVSQFALDVLSAWRKSTPTEPWTNNPLGHPYRGSQANQALDTPYAVFPTIGSFAEAVKRAFKLPRNQGIVHVLIAGDSYSAAWREIHNLRWPANTTESDYPHVLLDLVEEAYRAKIAGKQRNKRMSAGTQLAAPTVHEGVRAQGMAIHHAATSFANGRDAIRYIIGRLS